MCVHTALRVKALIGPQVATSGAQPGNANYRKGRLFADAIAKALDLPSRFERKKRIEAIADKLVSMAEDGDIQAIKEIADRTDGKAVQAIEGVMETVHSFAVPLPADTRTAAEWAQTIGK
jgi:hypothetical protein